MTRLILPAIRAIYEDRSGLLWFGTEQNGLNKLDPSANVFAHYRHDPTNARSLPHNNVVCFGAGRSGQLWIGTPEGLARFDPASESFTSLQGARYGMPSAGYRCGQRQHIFAAP
jgi:ligand-binding sensor domain-containing protein